MKFLHALLGVLLLALVLVLAASLMYDGAFGDGVILPQFGATGRFAVGLGLLVCLALYALTALLGRGRVRSLTFQTEGGTVSVRVQAMNGLIERLAGEFPDVRRLRSVIMPQGDTVDVFLSVRIRGSQQVTETCRQLQQRVRETLSENLGISHVRQVKVNVRELVPSRARRGAGASQQPGPDEEPPPDRAAAAVEPAQDPEGVGS